ncbi:MAG: VOC family protein [Rhodobacter sp.]|nr:VOC family protein [Rhodobacter sp.]
MGIKVSALDHVHLYVSDPQEAAEWYGRVLGLQIHPSSKILAGKASLYMATSRGQYCATIFPGKPPSDGDHTTAFRVPGAVFAAFGEGLPDPDIAARHGGLLQLRDADDHGLAWSYYFRDPDGNHLEITTYDHQKVRDWYGRLNV